MPVAQLNHVTVRTDDLDELRVGEGDRRHFLNPPGWKSGARARFWKGKEGEEVDQTRQALLEIYCAVVPETP